MYIMATTSSVFFYLILIMLGKTLPVFYAVYERTHNIISNLHRFDAETPLTAMSQVTKEIFMENTDFFPIKPVDYGRFLVISLGTGSNKREGRFTAQESSKSGRAQVAVRAPPPSSTSSRKRVRTWWTFTPLFSFKRCARRSSTFAYRYVCLLREGRRRLISISRSEPALRCMQDDTLTGDAASLDISRKENLEKLVKELLGKPVTRVNLENGNYEPVEEEGTNEEALTRFAQRLTFQ